MEIRVTKLETKFETILPTLATKADIEATKAVVAEAKTWVAISALAVVVAILSVMSFMLRPPQQTLPAAAPVPLVIYPQMVAPQAVVPQVVAPQAASTK